MQTATMTTAQLMNLNIGLSNWLDRIDPSQDAAKARELIGHRKAVRAELERRKAGN